MLVTTYATEYTVFGVSIDAYAVRPGKIEETLTTEKEQDLPICNFDYVLIYDEKVDNTYELELPDVGVADGQRSICDSERSVLFDR